MKVKWWVYALLALSLSIHAGVLAGAVLRRVQEWQWRRKFVRQWLKPGVTMRQVDSLFGWPDYRRSSDLGNEWRRLRREFGELALGSPSDSVRLADVLDRLAANERARRAWRAGIATGMRRFYRDEAWQRFSRWDSSEAARESLRERRWQSKLAARQRERGGR
jgi:hypothetical protein